MGDFNSSTCVKTELHSTFKIAYKNVVRLFFHLLNVNVKTVQAAHHIFMGWNKWYSKESASGTSHF